MDIYFFSFMKLCSKSASCNWIPQLFLKLQSFFKKTAIAAIITAIHCQKLLYWQLSKVTLYVMYNCNFEVINYNLLHKFLENLIFYSRSLPTSPPPLLPPLHSPLPPIFYVGFDFSDLLAQQETFLEPTLATLTWREGERGYF